MHFKHYSALCRQTSVVFWRLFNLGRRTAWCLCMGAEEIWAETTEDILATFANFIGNVILFLVLSNSLEIPDSHF